MNAPSASVDSLLRTNNLALAFQEVLTVILRTRFNVQRWDSAEGMRDRIRQMVRSATQNVSAIGYSRATVQMALYAIVGFLDESLLSSKDPIFSDWSRRPLQEELFGDQLAGEKFFRHVTELLNMPESSEVADILELHCLCLLLGFRGKYAYGDASEIDGNVRRIRDKIVRIRGPFVMVRTPETPPAPRAELSDRLLRNLSLAAIILAVICLAAYIAFHVLLSLSIHGAPQAAVIQASQLFAKSIGRIQEMSL